MTFGHDPEAIYQDDDIEMMELAAMRACPTCDGTTHVSEGDGTFSRCPTCDGEGVIE